MKKLASSAFVAFMLLIFLAAADAVYYAHMSSSGPIRAYPGLSRPVTGELPHPVDDVFLADSRQNRIRPNAYNDFLRRFLAFESDVSGLSVDFEELQGKLWRGVLRVSPRTQPGQHVFYVYRRMGDAGRKEPQTVQVYPDEASWRDAAYSFSQRHLGIQPWWLIIGSTPPLLASLLVLNRAAGREERTLLARGIVPVRGLLEKNGLWEVTFEMGTEHGVQRGEEMNVLDESLKPVGRLRVEKAGKRISQALLPREQPISPRHYVARKTAA